MFDLDGVKVLIDYAHNAAGLESLGDFVERLTVDAAVGGRPGEASWAANLRVAVVATAGDRRDEDMRALGRVAARYFDDIIIREDRNTRGRRRGETAELVLEGVRKAMAEGARAGFVEVAPDEMDATRKALDRSRPGDLVVLCVDYATEVFKELEARRSLAADSPIFLPPEGNGRAEGVDGDPDLLGV